MGRRSWAAACLACPAGGYATAGNRRPGSFVGGSQLLLCFRQQLGPGLHELLHALFLEHDEDVGQVDPDRRQLVEHLLGARGGAAYRVTLDFTVFGATSSVT